MPRLHHVNVSVRPGAEDAEVAFLTEVLGFRPVVLPPESDSFGARWYEGDDGVQIHISIDAEHAAARLAHTALVVGDEAGAIEQRLERAGVEIGRGSLDGIEIMIVTDPAGNRWELRSA
jgi:catechol 2,3-dioxygenase-like lactoylglutathione lyase family enzyme